jgi:hypothetical protein
MHVEAGRLRRGQSCDPPTFYETNAAAQPAHPRSTPCRAVETGSERLHLPEMRELPAVRAPR